MPRPVFNFDDATVMNNLQPSVTRVAFVRGEGARSDRYFLTAANGMVQGGHPFIIAELVGGDSDPLSVLLYQIPEDVAAQLGIARNPDTGTVRVEN